MTAASRRTLLFVYLALLVLLVLTIAASQLGLGPWGPVVNMSIAAIKTLLIFWFFMHLGEASPLVRLVAFAAFLWLGLLFSLGIADWLTRGPA